MELNVQHGEMPSKCKEFIGALTDNMWSFVVNHGKDTGDSPFISTEARRGNDHVMITWHTRATGTYRLFSCMVNKRDVTLTKALEAVRHERAT
jgi:hypothetical protein